MASRETVEAVAYRRSARSRELVRLAEQQYGVVSRDQMRRLGFKESAIDRRLRAHQLHEVWNGVYSLGHRVIPREGRWLAAVLASGPHAVLSHWSAAALWMIRPNSRSLIDVTTSRKSRSWDGIKRHHKAMPADEVTVHEEIPVTTVPRTIFDLAATEDIDTIVAMLRESEHRNRERDRRLKVAGYSVIHLTWNQLRDEPEAIASDLRVLLRDR